MSTLDSANKRYKFKDPIYLVKFFVDGNYAGAKIYISWVGMQKSIAAATASKWHIVTYETYILEKPMWQAMDTQQKTIWGKP